MSDHPESFSAESGEGELSMWTVYDHPLDYPDCYVAREWIVGPGLRRASAVVTAPTLNALRALIPPTANYWMPRWDFDDPVILGSWI